MQLLRKNIDFTSYTIAFDEKDFDESLYAKNIANYLKIKNKSFLINENEILRTINHLSSIYDGRLQTRKFLVQFYQNMHQKM